MKFGKVRKLGCILLGMLCVCQAYAYTASLPILTDLLSPEVQDITQANLNITEALPEAPQDPYTHAIKHTHITKKYNLFFPINSHVIDDDFRDNARTIETIRKDIEATISVDGALPDSILILATASPDGNYDFNSRLAKRRAASTKSFILDLFPEFKDTHIEVGYLEEDWDGLRQVLRANPDFPQRDEMLAVIESDESAQTKEYRLRALKEGWRYLVRNYIYALRNSSITISVVMTADNADDEFVVGPTPEPQPAPIDRSGMDSIQSVEAPIPHFDPQPYPPLAYDPPQMKYRKTIMAARTNLLMPGLSVGLEFPIHENWSVGINYNYPWAVSANNKWCVEKLSLFADVKYWFTNENTRWTADSRLKGHGVGLYAGTGYYDFQNRIKGAQGEFIDFGVDYTFAMPVANDKLRFEFNIGLGFIKTWYRPYNPSSDFSDLIKEPGVKFRSTNFVGPTKAGVSLVYPITVPVKKNPYIKMVKRAQRKAERQSRKAGGNND